MALFGVDFSHHTIMHAMHEQTARLHSAFQQAVQLSCEMLAAFTFEEARDLADSLHGWSQERPQCANVMAAYVMQVWCQG